MLFVMNLTSCFILISVSACTLTPIAVMAQTTYKANCETHGESTILSSTGAEIFEHKIVSFTPLKFRDGNHTGICIIKNDPPGYNWVSCSKRNGGYLTNLDGFNRPIMPIKAIKDPANMRGGFSGSCLVKL